MIRKSPSLVQVLTAKARTAIMSLTEYIILFVLVAILGAGLPGPGDAALIAAGTLSAATWLFRHRLE